MAKQQGWLRKKKYADGMTWLFCYQTMRQADGKRVENSKRVGLVADFPTETAAWMEVGKLGLQKYMDGSISNEPTDRDEHNLDRFILPRWGELLAGDIKPTEVERWFEILASTPQGRKKKPLKWPTIEKINSVMSQIYGHAQRHGLIPTEMMMNPFRHPKFGGARCKTQSDYEAKVVTPEQMVAILAELDGSETRLEWTLALVHAATALRPEECFALQWRDIDYEGSQILVRRAWSKGKETSGKTKGSMKPVAMHPALAGYLQEWRNESPYSKDGDWIFPSFREKGKIPRAASCCGKDYLRPAAVAAGLIAKEDRSRFGWHNLRHSLATFFGSNEVPLSTIQSMLRHAKPQTTARYIHAVNSKQVEAQGKFLDAIKLGAKRSTQAA